MPVGDAAYGFPYHCLIGHNSFGFDGKFVDMQIGMYIFVYPDDMNYLHELDHCSCSVVAQERV